MPCTITQTVPRALHSMQTLCAAIAGLRPARNAEITSRSCILLMGQPCSSKSTVTWAEIGVEVASVLI